MAYADALNRLFRLAQDQDSGQIALGRRIRGVVVKARRRSARAAALWHYGRRKTVAARLTEHGVPADIVVIKTGGDRLQEAPLSEAGGKRLFVKEIEDALLAGDIDLAVHSAKDMSAVLPDGLAIAAVFPREDPRDALVLPQGTPVVDFASALAHIGEMPTIATSSIRRIAQLTSILPQARSSPPFVEMSILGCESSMAAITRRSSLRRPRLRRFGLPVAHLRRDPARRVYSVTGTGYRGD